MIAFRVYATVFVVFLLDQSSKYYVVHFLNLAEVFRIDVFPPFLNLRMAWNQGINFGLFGSDSVFSRFILILISAIICIGLGWWVRKTKNKYIQISTALVIGGAFGNMFDRLLYGAVADFLNMSCCKINNPFSFNVADISIFAGALGLIFLKDSEEDRSRE
jgi:signal peptidase II